MQHNKDTRAQQAVERHGPCDWLAEALKPCAKFTTNDTRLFPVSHDQDHVPGPPWDSQTAL